MIDKDTSHLSQYDKGPRKGEIYRADERGFYLTRLTEIEVPHWEYALQGVAPDFTNLAVAGLSAVQASLREVTKGDSSQLASALAIPLYDDQQSRSGINKAFYEKFPVFKWRGGGLERTSELFGHGVTLLEAAKAASIMQTLSEPQIDSWKTVAGWNVNQSTYEVPIPFSEQENSGRRLNTWPAKTVALRFDRTDRGDGFESPQKLQFAARLWGPREPSSMYSNVSLINHDGGNVGVNVDAGFVHGIFGADYEYGEFTTLEGFTSVINNLSPNTPKS